MLTLFKAICVLFKSQKYKNKRGNGKKRIVFHHNVAEISLKIFIRFIHKNANKPSDIQGFYYNAEKYSKYRQ